MSHRNPKTHWNKWIFPKSKKKKKINKRENIVANKINSTVMQYQSSWYEIEGWAIFLRWSGNLRQQILKTKAEKTIDITYEQRGSVKESRNEKNTFT